MKKTITTLLGLSLILAITVQANAQSLAPTPEHKRLHKLVIRHADPQYIYLMLRGQAKFSDGPEFSVYQLGQFGNGGFGNGFGNGSGNMSGGYSGTGPSGTSGGGRPGTGSSGPGGNGRSGG